MENPMLIDWNEIDTVLLDMDGTILDRHFDDHFWLEHVPKRYAEKNAGISLEKAKEKLYRLFRSQENTLNWTDLDYWSEQLELDIPLLKRELRHLIAVHPSVVEFLDFLGHHEKKAYLVTNAHTKTLDLKLQTVSIAHHFAGIFSAHDIGLPKEDPRFWPKLQERVPYDPERTMLGEDSETNLSTADLFGIRYLIHVGRFSSQSPPASSDSFHTIHFFSELIPAGGMSVQI